MNYNQVVQVVLHKHHRSAVRYGSAWAARMPPAAFSSTALILPAVAFMTAHLGFGDAACAYRVASSACNSSRASVSMFPCLIASCNSAIKADNAAMSPPVCVWV